MKGIVTDIKRNSLDDGPGIRTLIFFKGCPLSCVWCQNPETKSIKQEISYDFDVCVNCQECQKICPYDAINLSKKYPINKNKCNYCGLCIDNCKTGALKFAAKEYTIEELVTEILKDKVFYDNSGGGITLSGGEPTVQMSFLHKFLKELKKHKIHVCLETCGYFNWDSFYDLILPYLDLIYYDLKLFNSHLHQKYCLTDNKLILQNFEKILKEGNIELLPRIPLIPNITTSKENLSNWIGYFKTLGIKNIALLPYNPLWLSKISKLGKDQDYNYSDWLTKEEKKEIKSLFKEFKFHNF